MGQGITPVLLLSQVRAAAPFALDQPSAPYLEKLAAWEKSVPLRENAVEYFELCLAAHWATAGSFLPTDVDNALRKNLWELHAEGPTQDAFSLLVLQSLSWDFAPVTAKVARTPSGKPLSTHEGTWLSFAAGAYAALKNSYPARAEELSDAMSAEVSREAGILSELAESRAWLELARACALVAHNLGDLDRVIDQWSLPKNDPLRLRLYKAAVPGCAGHDPLFSFVADFNTRFLAPENHRHFALRGPKCLRRRSEYLLPVGPFLDDWGVLIGDLRHENGLSRIEAGEIAAALIDGFERLPNCGGYARALAGLLSVFPGGEKDLSGLLTGRQLRFFQTGELRRLLSVPRERFEAAWAKRVENEFKAWRASAKLGA